MMKKYFFVLFALSALLLLLPAVNAATQQSTQQPAENETKAGLTFDFICYDFGELRFKKEPKTVEIPYRNTGDAPLVIIRTEQSCTCLSVEYSKKPLQPGETGVMKVTYTPTKFVGEFSNAVIVHSNSDTPRQRIMVTGTVVR